MKKQKTYRIINCLQYFIKLPFILFCIISVVFSCKKDDQLPARDEIISPTTGSRKELTLDSIFLYARQLYLWHEILPSYTDFDPRNRYANISPDKIAYERELFDISQYPLNSTGQPIEWYGYEGKAKYSYLETYSGTSGTLAATVSTDSYATHRQYWTQEDKKIGYFYLSSFPDLAQVQQELDVMANEWYENNITHLIIDLRHNGGGYVKTATYLANLIAPNTLGAKVMYAEHFNSRMQQGKATILQYQPYLDSEGKTVQYKGRLATMADIDYSVSANTEYFSKKGNWNSLQQLTFLVSNRTASAAELLISIFRSHIPIRLIGQQTYGKPVGFFPVRIDQYQVYFAGFLLQNAEGWSDYFDGIPVDIAVSADGSVSIGDVTEPLLAAALQDIGVTNKAANKTTSSISVQQRNNLTINPILIKDQFKLKKE